MPRLHRGGSTVRVKGAMSMCTCMCMQTCALCVRGGRVTVEPFVGENGGDPRVERDDQRQLGIGRVLTHGLEIRERHAVEALEREHTLRRGGAIDLGHRDDASAAHAGGEGARESQPLVERERTA